MLYLSGCKNKVIADHLAAGTIGFLKTPRISNTLEGVAVWAADNDCFTGNYVGDDNYLAWLDSLSEYKGRCLFVTVPDVIGDGAATLHNFPVMARRLRESGWPVALVGQDGMENMEVPWELCDWLFVGGSTAWKLGTGATRLIRQAQNCGKKVHVGRVNSYKRFALFAGLGCDTADGTFLAFGPEKNAPKLERWIRETDNATQGLLL